MSGQFRIETLDYTHPTDPNSHAVIAATMLVTEAYTTDVPGFGYESPQDYISRINPVMDTHYAVIDESGVVAVAEVMHRRKRSTEISGIVVRADKRGQGYARALIRHIAQEARNKDDIFLKVPPINPDLAERLGFAAVGLEEGDENLYALPEDILDPPPPPAFYHNGSSY